MKGKAVDNYDQDEEWGDSDSDSDFEVVRV
jgi:hypothetical protein